MQQLQPLAASQSHNPPADSLGRFRSYLTIKHLYFILAIILLSFATILIAHNRVDTKHQALNMQTISSTTTKNNVAQDVKTSNIKSIGTDPPPLPTSAKVTVNGQNVPVPSQGSTSQTIVSGNTQTNIEITDTSSTQNSSETDSSNSLNISVNSSSTSTDNSPN